jgi:hypothetical protein
MWSARTAVAGLVVLAGLAPAVAGSPASAVDERLQLTAGSDEAGWISLAVRAPGGGPVQLREVIAGRGGTVVRLALRDGQGERPRVARWRCDRRTRHFVATTNDPGDGAATATITTPSCANRLRMIVVPARLRPGQAAGVRISDTWRLGGVAATVCARSGNAVARCRRMSIRPGTRTRRARLRLLRPGRATIALRSQFGQRLTRRVDVRPDARVRVLVTGDSLVFGLIEALTRDLEGRAAVHGDPHPGRGISTPGFLDWPAHAQNSARALRSDVTVVFLGAADAGYPLAPPGGTPEPCCGPAWTAEYARRARAMMTSYLRAGRGLVYWVLLPAPRSPEKARVFLAENAAARQAGAGFDDGVRVIRGIADVIAPNDRFRATIRLGGRDRLVRDEDGVHLTAPGIRIATDIITATLRSDGLL